MTDINGLYRTDEPAMVRSAPASPRRQLPSNDNRRSAPKSPRKLSSFPSPTSSLLPIDSEEFLDDELIRYGYSIVDRMIILEDGNASTKYIIAKTPIGNEVVVDLDTQGFVSVDEEPKMYMTSVGYHDEPIDDYVVDLCENGLCIRGSDGKYIRLHTPESKDVGSRKASYPLISMSSIRLEPEVTSALVRDRSDSIISSCIECGVKANNEIRSMSQKINTTVDEYITLWSSRVSDISSTINQLEGYKNVYSKMKTLTPQESTKYQAVLSILGEEKSKLNSYTFKYNEILEVTSRLDSINDKLREMISSITTA